jgi:hypothetical protein
VYVQEDDTREVGFWLAYNIDTKMWAVNGVTTERHMGYKNSNEIIREIVS